MKMPRVLFILCSVAGFGVGDPTSGFSQTEPATIHSVQVGLDGSCRAGEWTAVNVEVSHVPAGATVEVVTSDPQGYPVTVAKDASNPAPLFIQPGRIETSLEVRLIGDEGKVLATKRLSTKADENGRRDFTVLRHTVPRWIVAGKLPAVDEMPKTGNVESTLSSVHVTRRSTKGFPTDPLELEAYETVLLSGEFSLDSAQAEALDTWVKRGGHLVCFLGDEDRVAAFQSSRLAGWFDIRIQTKRVSDLSGVEAFVQSELDDGDSEPLFIGARRVAVADVSLPDGIALDQGGLSGSVLTETARGFGRVTFVGFDMDRRPLSLWGERGSGKFLLKLAGVKPEIDGTNRRTSRVSRSGVTDLATQFREASEFLPGLGERSTLFVLGIVLFYLLIVGPADYLLVHRVLKRPQLTWITFPAIVVVGALLARSAARSSNGTELRVTQIDMIDIDTTSQFVRESAWCSVFSPKNERYRVALHSTGRLLQPGGEPATSDLKLGWFGMPEENYGGMYRAAGLELGKPGYRLNERETGTDNLPIPIWSNRSLRAESLGSTQRKFVESDLKRSGTGGQLSSDSRFSHSFPTPIEDWLIVYGNRVYFPKDLDSENQAIRPGEIWSPVDASVTSRDLAGYLNGTVFTRVAEKSVKSERISTTLTDYDSQVRDVFSILTMISFHEQSGGTAYTGLKNAALRNLELSRLLPLHRAVLIGRVSVPASTLELDGKPVQAERHESFVRVLLPVQLTERSSVLPDLRN